MSDGSDRVLVCGWRLRPGPAALASAVPTGTKPTSTSRLWRVASQMGGRKLVVAPVLTIDALRMTNREVSVFSQIGNLLARIWNGLPAWTATSGQT